MNVVDGIGSNPVEQRFKFNYLLTVKFNYLLHAPRMSASLPTPSASPSTAPPDRRPSTKRPRLTEKGSSTPPTDVDSARRASTLRVLNVWAQLAERYNKRLDEDDIVDLYSGAIIRDRGVLSGSSRDFDIGHFAQPEDGQEDSELDPEQEQEQEQDDDADELDTLSVRDSASDDDKPLISRKALLRRVPPLSVTTDADDLNEFLKAEKQRRELVGDEEVDEEDVMSAEELIALRKALAEKKRKKNAETTPALPSDAEQESDDELGFWEHDESTAVYPVARADSEQDVVEVEREVTEVTESDEEFEILLQRPSRSAKSSSPITSPKRVSSSHSAKSTPKPKSAKQREHKEKSEIRADRRTVPEVVIPKPSRRTTDKSTSAQERLRDSRTDEGGPRETTFKPFGLSRSKKRKRGSSPSTPHKTSDDDSRECRDRRRSTSPALSSSSIFTPHQHDVFPSPNYGSFGHRSVPPVPHEYEYDTTPRTRPLVPPPPPLTHPHPPHQRHPSHAPPLYPPPTNHPTTPGPPLPSHQPPPIDPMQTQQAQYLLAQAMHQLTYLMSASMPPYGGAYASSPGQAWHQPPLPPPPPTYATPPHHARSQSHPDPRAYHAPSSSFSRSALPPSSPPPRARSRSVSPHLPPEQRERRAPSRARSKSRGRRVSFKLDDEEISPVGGEGGREGRENANPKRDNHPASSSKGKGKKKESRDISSRSEEGGNSDTLSPPPRRVVARGRTPGPPSPRPPRQKS
ncbi:hypothetical protein F5I97DRAFT_2007752 [Phlebopus sp. FC_14]|nr:hypothetical protein F5I97DRAFT_2007752 [Phlebopus sp. FC_14]